MYARYKPSRDTFHYEYRRLNESRYEDVTDGTAWFQLYYARRHQNISDNENIYLLFHHWFGEFGDALWGLYSIYRL